MKTWVRYGKGRLEFEIPDGAKVVYEKKDKEN